MRGKIRNFSSRILLVVLLTYALTSFYYIFYLYQTKINAAEEGALNRLAGISNTLSTQINGTLLKMILETYPEKDDVYDKYSANMYYREIAEILHKTAELNDLPTDIYTLTYDSISDMFFFGITSSEKQYFRHLYTDPPEILRKNYTVGATIPAYQDEHGTWLSAFSPLTDADGEVTGVVQVDLPFDKFIADSRRDLYWNIALNSFLFLIVAVLMFYWLRTMLKREEGIMNQLSINNEIINKKNEDITASISYAQRIQRSLMDSENKLKSLFPSSFVFYRPKDIVSGDFYWIQKMEGEGNRIAVAAADCTGHGVPGALVSVLGITILRDIVGRKAFQEPNEILQELNRKTIETFKTKNKGMTSKDGMDISMCVIDQDTKTLCYAGAYRPLVLIRNNEIIEISGDKYPIGGDHFAEEREFKNHQLQYEPGDWIYMFSDGYIDQFGGAKGKKFMRKRLKNRLLEIYNKHCDEQCELLEKDLNDWQGEYEQVDDITLMGLQLP